MSTDKRFIPTSSQTVGPYFRIGLDHLIDSASATDLATAITIRGRVLDRDQASVPDAMLEFWSPGHESSSHLVPEGFRRVVTDFDGCFTVTMPKPLQQDGQAPHLLVLIFARGLLRHLISRVYFDQSANSADLVLSSVPPERRNTLIARSDGLTSFRWDVILQGAGETVFFAW